MKKHGRAHGIFQWTNLDALRTAPDIKLRDISEGIKSDARANCPVDTGALRNSIHVSSQRLPGQNLTVSIYTHVEYAPYQEYGTRHIAAKAFMGKALANARARYGA